MTAAWKSDLKYGILVLVARPPKEGHANPLALSEPYLDDTPGL